MPNKKNAPWLEKVRIGVWGSLFSVLFRGVRLTRNRWRFHGERLMRNQPCPCGSGKKFKRCHGR